MPLINVAGSLLYSALYFSAESEYMQKAHSASDLSYFFASGSNQTERAGSYIGSRQIRCLSSIGSSALTKFVVSLKQPNPPVEPSSKALSHASPPSVSS
ncbi:P20 [Hamiltonella phage APSE-1]|uniref:Putative protein p20 n=1 Tax=Acyrthosiphon pisum secondary endosymbiont phage 1 TaxID=2682836 RepID=VP20_BPAPS|nr:hypothetical protein APSE-1_20 [Hamiltonella phage APSE-1]Q9T1S8.1 RecName: Full=Putative protein p20 [Hamiltonella phage APSE-1]AAF03963.1 P20 [Hamiltonella phage APSE-1]